MSGLQDVQMERYLRKTDVEWHNTTTLHPIGLSALIVLATWMFLAPRRWALTPMLIMICFVPSAQRIVVAGADFSLLRLMSIAGIARILVRNELTSIRFNRIDLIYFVWVVVGSLVYVLQRQDVASVVYVCGTSLDMIGPYLLARSFVRNIEDLRIFAATLAALAIVVSLFFAVEMLTRRNIFSVFGGVPEITVERHGRLRCQGAFSHAIVAGVFWAAVGALLVGAAFGGHRRFLSGIAALACVGIIGATASSTPVLGFIAGIAFWLWWPARSLMRYAFLAAPFMLIGLHIVMEAPVWHLVSRVSAVGGSTGYHRFVLIDGAIRHFNEWWLLGTPWTGHWSPHFQTWDITNQYVLEGVRGGIWRLGLFCLLVLLVALSIAKAQARAATRADRLLLWGLGASLFVHCVCFIGVSYFGQIQYLWYMTLALGAGLAERGFCDAKHNMLGSDWQAVRPVHSASKSSV